MSEKRCLKCSGEMRKRQLHKYGPTSWSITGASLITPYVCKECGYVEFYAR